MIQVYFFLLPLLLCSCEVFVFGVKRTNDPVPTRETSVGVVYMFKAELDSGNTQAAARLLLQKNGQQYLAMQRYEMYDEMARLGRVLSKAPITKTSTDTLSRRSQRHIVEFNYRKTISFTTTNVETDWYITDIQE